MAMAEVTVDECRAFFASRLEGGVCVRGKTGKEGGTSSALEEFDVELRAT